MILKGMNSPMKIAAVVFGAALSTCFWFGGVDLASAGPIAASKQSVASQPAATLPEIKPHGRVYLFRGAMGPFFSRGMDHLTERIERVGITANVYEFTICRIIAAMAIHEYREAPAPIILIGHSMGGYCAVKFAEILQAENIPVNLIVTIDPAHATPDVPLNVERFINIFLSTSVLGGGDVRPKPGYQGHYASFDLSRREEVSHINIEKMDSLQEQLVVKIVQLASTSLKGEGEAVPIRCVVPPDVPIELWDSGMPVFARPGDTLQTIAALNHVPLWALSQVNKGVGSAPLVPGERIVVPRHLTP